MIRHFVDLFDLARRGGPRPARSRRRAEARRPAGQRPAVPLGPDARPDLREAVAADAGQLRGRDRPARRQRDLPPRQGRRHGEPREHRRLRAGHQPVRRRPGRADLRARHGRGAGPARDDPDHQRPLRPGPPVPGAGRHADDPGGVRAASRASSSSSSATATTSRGRWPLASALLGLEFVLACPAGLRVPGRLPRPVRGGLPRSSRWSSSTTPPRRGRGRRGLHRRLGEHGPGARGRPPPRRSSPRSRSTTPAGRPPAATRSSCTACPPTAARKSPPTSSTAPAAGSSPRPPTASTSRRLCWSGCCCECWPEALDRRRRCTRAAASSQARLKSMTRGPTDAPTRRPSPRRPPPGADRARIRPATAPAACSIAPARRPCW